MPVAPRDYMIFYTARVANLDFELIIPGLNHFRSVSGTTFERLKVPRPATVARSGN